MGTSSDADIAQLLNDAGYRTKKGRPFSKDTVRDMLQNHTYLGKVKYQEYRRNADRSRSHMHRSNGLTASMNRLSAKSYLIVVNSYAQNEPFTDKQHLNTMLIFYAI